MMKKFIFIFLLLLLNIIEILCLYQGFRHRRQVDGSSNGSQIDLNITVPYIFSARLYPYGTSKDDKLVQVDPTAFNLQTPLKLLDHTYNSLYVHKDGFISLSGDDNNGPVPLIAVYWTKIRTGKVYFRESSDPSILNVAQNEVNIQYRYGSEYRPSSVAIITWETSDGNTDGNVFQLALILGDNGCFAHIVYSKLNSNSDAVAGFTSDDETSTYFALPGSGTPQAIQLVEKSNIGIPGEWLFRIDSEQIYLCGAGFQGLECVDSCLPTQWYLDCSKQCHCSDGNPCNTETGECPDAKCNPGWTGAPVCDEDIDECAENSNLCPSEQPDCVNTPGAYLCLCFEYDNSTNSCLGAADRGHPNAEKSATIAVPVMALNPRLPQRIQDTTQKLTTRRIRPTIAFSETEFITTTTPTTTESTTIRTSPTTRPRPISFNVTPISPKQKLFDSECSNCAPEATCINGRCQCNIGWKGNGKTCEEVNECLSPLTCGENAICQNTIGSYQCVCNVGFIATSSGCKDYDECSSEIVTCKGGNTTHCVNTIGGYECQCKPGYSGDPEIGCKDIDECGSPEYHCGSKATCINEIGGHRCECLEGYEKLGSTCSDINECLHNPCDPAALCTNVEGTFKCECIDGFVGNGIECHETILFPYNAASPVSNAPVALDTPITVFGNKYEKLYISDNGVISFDMPLYGSIEDISETHSIAFFPFYRKNSPASVTFEEISEKDASRYSLLTRASLTAQNKFKQSDFRAKTLYIITFKDDSSELAYQVVMAQSKNSTYATFLYEKVEDTSGATVGISSNNKFFNIPTELLSHNSNIGQRGKWTYRVDRASGLLSCPAGNLGPPLCQQDCPAGTWGFECINKCHCADNVPCDFGTGYCANSRCAPGFRGANCYDDIDECSEGIARCHINAKCINIPGGYECKCNPTFMGDGFTCTEMDKCQLKYGQPCSQQGICQVTPEGDSFCTCKAGYIGDGNTCTKQEETTTSQRFDTSTVYTTWPTKTTGRIFVEPDLSESSKSTETVDEHPFIMNNWISAEVTAAPKITTTTISRPIITLTTKPKTPIESKEPIGNEYTDIDNSIVEEATIEGDDDNYFTAVVILLPAALFIVWFILLIALGIYCCKRRQTARRNKYHLEMMGWSRQDYTSPRSSHFSHFAYT